MDHLTDEELEQILAGEVEPPAHLQPCDACRKRLDDHRAIRARLRSAFEAMSSGDDCENRLRENIAVSALIRADITPAARGKARRILRLPVRALAAAAAVLLIGIPIIYYFAKPQVAAAAQMELVAIHQHNLSGHNDFFVEDEPEKLADYFRNRLGFVPAMPRVGAGMTMRGCCVRHFNGRVVGSYVVDTPHAVISVIVVTDKPESLGTRQEIRRNGTTYLAGSFARNNIVTIRLAGYTYCAVGEVPTELLADLLSRLILDPN